MKRSFNFYDVTVQVSTSDPIYNNVVEHLAEDFSYFAVPELAGPSAKITLVIEPAPDAFPLERFKELPFVFRTKMCRVFGWGPYRCCDYGDGLKLMAESKPNFRRFAIFKDRTRWAGKSETDQIFEIAYLALLSSVGEELDLLGYHRIHALGIFCCDSKEASLLWLPSGGGKSSIAALILQKTDSARDPESESDISYTSLKLFSDEMPLVRGNLVFPFPIRIALKPEVAKALSIDTQGLRVFRRTCFPEKVLLPIPANRVARQPAPIASLWIGQRAPRTTTNTSQQQQQQQQLQPRTEGWSFAQRDDIPAKLIAKFPLAKTIPFIISMVMGLGLAQMSEHMLRSNNIFKLLAIAISRLKQALILLYKPRVGTFVFSPNAFSNFKVIHPPTLYPRNLSPRNLSPGT